MVERTGFILSIGDIEQAWHIEHGVKAEEHTNMSGYGYLRRDTEVASHGLVRKELAKNLMLGLDKFLPGGVISEYTHVTNDEFPVFDHAYYMISGKIQGTVGNVMRTVGTDSLIYCPSNVKHAILNVGKSTTKVLRIAGCDEGEKWVVGLNKHVDNLGVVLWIKLEKDLYYRLKKWNKHGA